VPKHFKRTKEFGPTCGRTEECSLADQFSGRLADGHSDVVVLRGAAGVGKSHLLQREFVRRSSEIDVQVLHAAGRPTEGRLSYAGLADLLNNVELAALDLPGPQRAVLEVVLRRRPANRSSDPLTMHTATRSVLAGFAKSAPILLAIDDLQWLDSSTIAALMFAVPRLQAQGLAVGVVATWRSGEGHDDVLESFVSELGARNVVVGLLDASEIANVVVHVAPELSVAEVARITEHAAGVPLFAVELAHHGGDAASMPESISASFGRRLRGLSTAASRVIGLTALSEEAQVATIVLCVGQQQVDVAIDELTNADLAVRHGDVLKLRHPLVRPVVLSRLSSGDSRSLRLMLADAVPTDSERAQNLRAVHAPPHAHTAAVLSGAVDEHLGRGATVEAALLAATAVDYTPTNDSEYDTRIVRALRLMVDALRVDAIGALIARIEPGRAPSTTAWIRWAEATEFAMRGDFIAASALLHEVPGLSEDPEPAQRAMVDNAFLLVQLGRGMDAVAVAGGALDLVEHLPNALRSEVFAVDVVTRAVTAQEWSRPQLAEALRLEDFELRTQPYLRASGIAAMVAIFDDDLRAAETHLLRLVDQGAAAGPIGDPSFTALFLAYVRLRLGTSAVDGVFNTNLTWYGGMSETLQQLNAGKGQLDSVVGFVQAIAQQAPIGAAACLSQVAGWCLAADRSNELAELATLYWMLTSTGPIEPIMVAWATDLAEAFLVLGQLDEAVAVVSSLGELTREHPRRSLTAAMQRVEALRCDLAGDAERAISLATESVTGFQALGWQNEYGRSLLVRAQVSYREQHYRAALDDATHAAKVFEQTGWHAWARVADRAVERYTRRRAAGTGRTVTQGLVAELVREGRTNREIANRLHVSVKTVESHLTAIYRQAGVTSRGAFQALGSDDGQH
jgi:DNA-binding CsgD family transcriptional regulator